MNKNTKMFLFGAITMLVVLWTSGCNLASEQAAEEEDWYTMINCECAGIAAFVFYLIFIELDSDASSRKKMAELRHDLNEALSRIRELEEKHAQEVEKCENNRA